jgi:YegS/Rv2252/BmrU family lipid kinase
VQGSTKKKAMKKTIVVYNSLSGSINEKLINRINRRLLLKGFDTRLFSTSKVNEAYFLIRDQIENKRENVDFVTVIGGDGIINDAVNALAGKPIPLAVIPSGTGNSFAKDKKIPLHYWKAVNIINEKNIKTVDLGLINDEKYFLMMCSSGFDVRAISNISPRLKRRFKLLAYLYHGFRSFFYFKPAKLKVSLKGSKESISGYFCIISNIASYGIPQAKIAPHASIADGKLDVCVFTSDNKQSLIKNILAIFIGQHINFKNVIYFQTSEEVLIEQDDKYKKTLQKVQIDGDLFKEMPVRVRVSPKALNIFLPGR